MQIGRPNGFIRGDRVGWQGDGGDHVGRIEGLFLRGGQIHLSVVTDAGACEVVPLDHVQRCEGAVGNPSRYRQAGR
jgi:hypothetical protein